MADRKQKRPKGKDTNAGVEAERKTVAGMSTEAVGGASAGANAGADEETAAADKGVKNLRIAVDKAIDLNSGTIADTLLKQTLDGNISSAKVLISLGAPQTGTAKAGRRRPGRSAATAFAREKPWPETLSEETAENGVKGREPQD